MKALDEEGRRTLVGWAYFASMTTVWTAIAFFFPPLGAVGAAIMVLGAALDRMMNGRFAEFAPFGFGGAALTLVAMLVSTS